LAVNALAGRGIATAGAVLAIVAIWIDATPGESYWDFDGTLAGFGLALGIIAALLIAAGYTGAAVDGALFAVGAVLIGYWGWFPAATAFDHWDDTRAGMWLAFAGGVLIAEQLRGLDQVAGRRFHLTALPIALTGSDGAPARVIARTQP